MKEVENLNVTNLNLEDSIEELIESLKCTKCRWRYSKNSIVELNLSIKIDEKSEVMINE